MAENKNIDDMKKRILEKYDRMGVEDSFTFKCDKSVSCFTDCCGDVNIFLTPYDIMRLKNNLKISSGEFLRKYTQSPFKKDQKFPVVLLKMNEQNNKKCFFVTEEGCSVYNDRPWSCRMYPIGFAQAEGEDGMSGEEFYFLMKEDICKGIGHGKEWTIKEWVMNQEIDPYNDFGESYKKLTLHPFFQQGNDLPPEKIGMFYMALYDLDKFREFLFESKFFDSFVVEPELRELLKTHDSELLRFGFRWLHFALFGQNTIEIKKEVKDEFEVKKQDSKEKA